MTWPGPLIKPARGSAYLRSKDRRADRRDAEQAEMQAALVRDSRRCRWPGCSGKYRGLELPIDPAHIFEHRGSGGNPDGTRTRAALIAALCRRHHSLLDAGEIQIEALTTEMADGPLAFYEQHPETGAMAHKFTETTRGQAWR